MPISTPNSTTANNHRRPFFQPGGVPHTFAVRTNWLNVHAGIMYSLAEPGSHAKSGKESGVTLVRTYLITY